MIVASTERSWIIDGDQDFEAIRPFWLSGNARRAAAPRKDGK